MDPAEQSNAGQILAMGEILVDFIVADGATTLESAETFVARSGGAPANASVALARLGLASAFCGVVGDDPFGSRLQAELAAEGVDTSRLRQSGDAATTLAFAWKDPGGDGHFWLLRGADALLSEADVRCRGHPQPGRVSRRFGRAFRSTSAERDRSSCRPCAPGRRTRRLRCQSETDPLV